jgi:hypothetical protein
VAANCQAPPACAHCAEEHCSWRQIIRPLRLAPSVQRAIARGGKLSGPSGLRLLCRGTLLVAANCQAPPACTLRAEEHCSWRQIVRPLRLVPTVQRKIVRSRKLSGPSGLRSPCRGTLLVAANCQAPPACAHCAEEHCS